MTLARLSPAGFLAAYVLVSFSATPNPMLALWRPLVIAIGAAVVLQLVLTVALRDRDRGALVASAVVLVMTAAWVPLVVVASVTAWFVAIRRLRRRRGEPELGLSTAMLARNLGFFALAFAVVAAVPVLIWGLTTADAAQPEPIGQAAADQPDIVVLLLDGYPRADALTEQFGADNGAFEAELSGRGFRVAANSRSNYTSTWATLTSMFFGEYLDALPRLEPAPSDPAEQYRQVILALADPPVLDALRQRGYEIVTVPSPFESAALTGADRILAPPQLTSFELSLLQHSLLGQAIFSLAPSIVFDQHRGRLESTLELLTDEVARPSDTPRFFFAHLLAPHAPLVYRADGSPAAPVSCFPGCSIYGIPSAADWAGFPAQLEHVNRMVLAALEAIVADQPDAIVIVMSDHGSHRTGSADANAFRNFFAARVPGNPTLYEDGVTPLTVLARLAGMPLDPAEPYRGWISADLQPLSLTPYLGPPP